MWKVEAMEFADGFYSWCERAEPRVTAKVWARTKSSTVTMKKPARNRAVSLR